MIWDNSTQNAITGIAKSRSTKALCLCSNIGGSVDRNMTLMNESRTFIRRRLQIDGSDEDTLVSVMLPVFAIGKHVWKVVNDQLILSPFVLAIYFILILCLVMPLLFTIALGDFDAQRAKALGPSVRVYISLAITCDCLYICIYLFRYIDTTDISVIIGLEFFNHIFHFWSFSAAMYGWIQVYSISVKDNLATFEAAMALAMGNEDVQNDLEDHLDDIRFGAGLDVVERIDAAILASTDDHRDDVGSTGESMADHIRPDGMIPDEDMGGDAMDRVRLQLKMIEKETDVDDIKSILSFSIKFVTAILFIGMWLRSSLVWAETFDYNDFEYILFVDIFGSITALLTILTAMYVWMWSRNKLNMLFLIGDMVSQEMNGASLIRLSSIKKWILCIYVCQAIGIAISDFSLHVTTWFDDHRLFVDIPFRIMDVSMICTLFFIYESAAALYHRFGVYWRSGVVVMNELAKEGLAVFENEDNQISTSGSGAGKPKKNKVTKKNYSVVL